MENLAFSHLNLFDGRIDSDLQEDVTVLVEVNPNGNLIDGTITEIGPSKSVDIPLSYRVIDLSGKFVIPGLINAHCHLFGDGRPSALLSTPESILRFFG